MLEIYAGFDSRKVCQVALCNLPTNLRIIQAKVEKGKSVKARRGFLRFFLDINYAFCRQIKLCLLEKLFLQFFKFNCAKCEFIFFAKYFDD